ncbi:hypothetical protein BJY04DRAFT_216963 [Aspergillus karnatakaensis]|uniref:uncharacterized protein n=1 Tax=Aspergillus karnatakaensis TaxID=1810916 RepID=UPI003CCD464A
MLYRPNTRWTWIAFLSLFTEALLIITMETVLFALFNALLKPESHHVGKSLRTVATSFSLATLGCLYKLVILYDTLSQQNTIQVLALGVYSITQPIYNGLQYERLKKSFHSLGSRTHDVISDDEWRVIQGLIISIITISAVFTLWIFPLAWKLYNEFAWVTFRQVEADLVMRNRFLHFQLFITLLKFGGFYILGFLVQLVAIQANRSALGTTCTVLIPATCFLLLGSPWVVRHERRNGTMIIITLHTALAAFFIWVFVRMYQPETEKQFRAIKSPLTFFGTVALLISFSTIAMACICYRNFRRGLRPYIAGDRKARILGEEFEMMESRRLYTSLPRREQD